MDDALTDTFLRGEAGAVISDLACFPLALAMGHRARYKKKLPMPVHEGHREDGQVGLSRVNVSATMSNIKFRPPHV